MRTLRDSVPPPHITPVSFALLALCLLGWPRSISAQVQRPLDEVVRVEPGATCVTKTSLTPQVEAWLGTEHVDAELTVSVQGSADDPRDVSFDIRRAGKPVAQRRFHPAPFVCTQLEATLALAIAMALKVSLRAELLETLGGEVKAPQARASAGGLVRVGYDLLPGASLGMGLSASQFFGERFAVRTELSVDGARNARFDDAPGSFDTWLLSAQVSGCVVLPLHPAWRARACTGLALAGLRVRGYGYKESYAAWLPWIGLANSVGLSVQISPRWWLDLPAALLVPLNKVTVGVQGSAGNIADERTLPRVGFTTSLGPQYHF